MDGWQKKPFFSHFFSSHSATISNITMMILKYQTDSEEICKIWLGELVK